jgi:lipid-binding SYLF domain-containing protein
MLDQRWLIGTVALVMLALGPAAFAQTKEDEQRTELRERAQETLDRLFTEIEGSKELFDAARGYAVFAATRGGFIVTAGGGSGVAVDKATSDVAYMKMTTGGIGFGAGAERFDMVIYFETKERLDDFINGGWSGDAAAGAVAGSDGAGVASSFVDGEIVYLLAERGLMASADVSGTKFRLDDDLN